jgi:hypothetical protein
MGMLSSEPELFAECEGILKAEYGEFDLASDTMPWEITDYYQEEMGTRIFRRFVFFEDLIDPANLSRVKLFTNEIEDRFKTGASSSSRRRINIDPGYVTEAKVVLASTKDFSHRIYIGGNIYAEVTLSFNSKTRSFSTLDHTYFDFRTETYKKLFNSARDLLRKKLNRKG